MHKKIIHSLSFILFWGLLLLGVSTASMATSPPFSEVIIDGLRYFYGSTRLNEDGTNQIIEIGSLRAFGFYLDPENEDKILAPDGSTQSLGSTLVLVPLSWSNWGFGQPTGTFPSDNSPYSGEIYLKDCLTQEDYKRATYNLWGWTPSSNGNGLAILFVSSALGKNITALRTPKYMPLHTEVLQYATNMQKLQIGTCYAVEPQGLKNCGNLETVIFENAPYVYREAFLDSPKIQTIVLQSEEELPYLEKASVFPESVYSNATVYIPDTLMEEANAAPVWSKFENKRSLRDCPADLLMHP